jgi:hypothetical protein
MADAAGGELIRSQPELVTLFDGATKENVEIRAPVVTGQAGRSTPSRHGFTSFFFASEAGQGIAPVIKDRPDSVEFVGPNPTLRFITSVGRNDDQRQSLLLRRREEGEQSVKSGPGSPDHSVVETLKAGLFDNGQSWWE